MTDEATLNTWRADAADRLRRIALAEADAIADDGNGSPLEATYLLFAAAAATAKLCNVDDVEYLYPLFKAVWDATSVKRVEGYRIVEGGES